MVGESGIRETCCLNLLRMTVTLDVRTLTLNSPQAKSLHHKLQRSRQIGAGDAPSAGGFFDGLGRWQFLRRVDVPTDTGQQPQRRAGDDQAAAAGADQRE